MQTINCYLNFGGRCQQALDFYQATLGAVVEMKMLFNQCPEPMPEGMVAPGCEDKVMHASFRVGQTLIMASDGSCRESNLGGFSLVLSVDDDTEAHRAVEALSQGGSVAMPLRKTFFSPCYGIVTDRFGVCWMVMVPA